ERDSAQWSLYVADMRRAHSAWQAGEIGHVQELLWRHRPQGGRRDLRGWEWYYLNSLGHGEVGTLVSDQDVRSMKWSALSWSPDGRRLAASDRHGCVTIWDLLTRQKHLVLRTSTWLEVPFQVVWSPDGRHLACAVDAVIKVWDARTGKQVLVLTCPMSLRGC